MRFRKEKEADEKYTVKVSEVIITLLAYDMNALYMLERNLQSYRNLELTRYEMCLHLHPVFCVFFEFFRYY